MNEWDRRYKKGDTPWEKGYAAPPLTEFLARGKVAGKVFVPGCGTGHDARILAAQGARVTGLDIAPRAIRLANAHPIVNRETYLPGDLFNLPRRLKNKFDWVFEHTCFCAISPALRADYVRDVHSVLKNSGRLLAVFFLNPDNDGKGPPFGVDKKELDALFGHCFELIEEWTPKANYPGREGRELMRILKKRPKALC